MECKWCKKEVPELPETAHEHLVVTKTDGHYHVHGPLDKPEELKIMINAIIHEMLLRGHTDIEELEVAKKSGAIPSTRQLLILND